MGVYLQVRVIVDLTKPIPQGRLLKLLGNSVCVDFQYERLPHFYFQCGLIRHGASGCTERGGT